ncbi:MAG: TIGR04290 family methyltransferase [Sinobacteraceae bacterium]|nr:TIGR04290 family methyltransferase [Nevskiaceae bacterium]
MSASSPQPQQRELAAEAAELGPWFHNLHLPDGTQTALNHPLGDFPRVKWLQIAPYIDADLHGVEVLDVGCNAGFYTLELAARGAHVTGIDIDARYLAQARWAATHFNLQQRVDFRQASIYEFAHQRRRFDVVWFLGVLYHLRHPLLALDIVRELTGRQMILQTLTMPGETSVPARADIGLYEREKLTEPGWPRMAFIEGKLASDPTNWWAPDPACVEAMLRSAGFKVTAQPGHEIYLCEPEPEESALFRELRQAELAVIAPAAARAGAGGPL